MRTFEYFVDKKYTVWERERVYINAENELEAIKMMIEDVEIGNYEPVEWEMMYDTQEFMHPNEDEGRRTLCIEYRDHIIYNNTEGTNYNEIKRLYNNFIKFVTRKKEDILGFLEVKSSE